MTVQNPLAVLDEGVEQMTPAQIINQAMQNTQDSLGQTGAMLTDPQAILAGVMQPLQGMADLAGDPKQYLQKQIANLLTNGVDPDARRRRKQQVADFMAQGQQDYLSGMQAVQLPTGGFVGGPNRGLI